MNLFITFSISFLIVLFAILLMGIGSVYGRGSIRGSCGGVTGRACELCSSERRDGGDADTPASPVVTSNNAKEF